MALSPDTRALLEGRGYTFRDDELWGIAEGITAGSPKLADMPAASGPHALPLRTSAASGATMFGAHDPRGGAGSSVPAN